MRRGRPGPLPARSASTGPGRAQVASPGSRPSAKPSAMMRKTSSTLQCTPIRTPAMRPSANVARTAYSQLDRVGTANGGEDNPLLVDPDCTVRGFAPLLRVLVPSSSSTPVNRHRAVRHRSTRGTSQGHSALPGGAAASGAGCRAAPALPNGRHGRHRSGKAPPSLVHADERPVRTARPNSPARGPAGPCRAASVVRMPGRRGRERPGAAGVDMGLRAPLPAAGVLRPRRSGPPGPPGHPRRRS